MALGAQGARRMAGEGPGEIKRQQEPFQTVGHWLEDSKHEQSRKLRQSQLWLLF